MDESRRLLEDQILDRIRGKLDYSQSPVTREAILKEAFDHFCKSVDKTAVSLYGCLLDDKGRADFFEQLQGLGIVDELLGDPQVEDIIINGTEPVYIHNMREGLKKTQYQFESLAEVDRLIKKMMVFGGKKTLKKINNVDLLGIRGRVNIIYSPFGPEVTITRIRQQPMSIIDLVEKGSLTIEMAALLWLFVEGSGMKVANILISGGPGSGKTTLLNALFSFIPRSEHIVVMEDTFELNTSWIENTSRLETDDDVSLANLVKNSLRMRPDRIVVGEVRGEEAQDMITVMNVGKYCLATIHASTPRETVIRLESAPMNVPVRLLNLIDVFIVMRKVMVDESVVRVVDAIAETAGVEQQMLLLSALWKFDYVKRSFIKESPTTIFRDKLAQITGKSGKEVMNEVDRRTRYLVALREKGVRSVADVSVHCEAYIKDPSAAIAQA
jgi:archaeal flagellar protein FlaI